VTCLLALSLAATCVVVRGDDPPTKPQSRRADAAARRKAAATRPVRGRTPQDVLLDLAQPFRVRQQFPPDRLTPAEEQTEDSVSTSTAYTAGVLQDSTEARNWMRRAAEGLEAGDDKLAVDALQRLIDMGGDAVVSSDRQVYVSARRHGHQLIAELPPSGLRAYRLLHDPEARKLYERAVREHDEAALVTVVSRFLITTHGDDAADLLASWYLDEGRASEAASVLIDLLTLYPDSDLPLSHVRGKLALAHALLGESVAARQALERATADNQARHPSDRLAALADLVARIAPSTAGRGNDWPMLGGGPDRHGRMAPATLDCLRAPPRVRDIPMHEDANDVAAMAKQLPRMPAFQAVTDGEQLLVKTDSRLMALDWVSLQTLWQSVPLHKPVTSGAPAIDVVGPRAGVRIGAIHVQSRGANPGSWPTALFGDVEGGVTVNDGLAFVIGRSAQAPSTDDDPWQRGAKVIQRFGAPAFQPGQSDGAFNQVLAFSLSPAIDDDHATGRSRDAAERTPVWVAGNTGTANDPLEGVEFLAPPIPVGKNVLVPYRQSADLYAAVIHAATGAMVRSIYLCGVGSSGVDAWAALYPAFADQVVYVPTGQGVFVAISTADYSIRWVSRYPRITDPHDAQIRVMGGRRVDQSNRPVPSSFEGWNASPPVMVGSLVVLAPTDGNRLFAFERRTGRIVWDIPREKHRYILGVTPAPSASGDDRPRDLIVLGGNRLSAIDPKDGRTVWTAVLGKPTGRGALIAGEGQAHDRVIMPTNQWVAVVDAATGEVLERMDPPLTENGTTEVTLAGNRAGLGNLLSWGGSLVSIEPGALRRFHDLDRAYLLAREAHQADPRDRSVVMRLASLELLRDDPRAALDLIEGLDALGLSAPERSVSAGRLVRQQVQALVMLADRAEAGDVAGLLERATEVAITPEDRFMTRMALAGHHADAGDAATAFGLYVDLCLSPLGRMLMPTIEPETTGLETDRRTDGTVGRCRGWRIVAGRLPALHHQLAPEVRTEFDRVLTERLNEAATADDMTTVRTLADAGLLPAIAQRANLLLARHARQGDVPQNERAEFFLERAVGRGMHSSIDPDPELAAAALSRLAAMDIAENQLPVSGLRRLDRLERRYGELTLPAEIEGDGRVTVSSFVADWRSRVPDAARQAYHQADQVEDRIAVSPTTSMTGMLPQQHAWPIHVDGRRPETFRDVSLFLFEDRQGVTVYDEPPPGVVQSRAAYDLSERWPAELLFAQDWAGTKGLPPSFARFNQINPQGGIDHRSRQAMTTAPASAKALVDGQTMIVTSTRGVHAIGLTSGLRLWARALPDSFRYRPGSDHPIALADRDAAPGLLAMILTPNVLEVVSTLDGATVWRRELADGDLGRVVIKWNAVVTVSRDLRRVWVFDLDDGRLLTSLRFDGVTDDTPVAALEVEPGAGPVVFNSVVCGIQDRGVVGYDLRTGEPRWPPRRATQGKIQQLFKPDAELFGVGSNAGELVLIDPLDGRVVLDAKIEGFDGAVIDAALQDDVIVVQGRIPAQRRFVPVLFGVSATDGTVLWKRELPDGRLLPPEQLRAADNAVPVLEAMETTRTVGEDRLVEAFVRVTLIDKRTGQDIGKGVPVPVGSTFQLDGAIEVGPGRITVGGRDGAVVFQTRQHDRVR
jgi:outer membrane protein assembly factor BamB